MKEPRPVSDWAEKLYFDFEISTIDTEDNQTGTQQYFIAILLFPNQQGFDGFLSLCHCSYKCKFLLKWTTVTFG